MSSTTRTLFFTVGIADHEKWTPEHKAACAAAMGRDPEELWTPDDWVTRELSEAMRTAGEKFIAEHPDLFKGKEIV